MTVLNLISLRTPDVQAGEDNKTPQSPHYIKPERTPGLDVNQTAPEHHSLIQIKLCSFLFVCTVWLSTQNHKTFAAVASKYLTEAIILPGAVIWNLFLLFFFGVWSGGGGGRLPSWLSPAPTFQECLSTQGRSSCAHCKK